MVNRAATLLAVAAIASAVVAAIVDRWERRTTAKRRYIDAEVADLGAHIDNHNREASTPWDDFDPPTE